MRAQETYNDQVVRLFLLAAAVWGIVGMSIGVYAAAEMVWPSLNFGVPWLTFSRIRPDHTFGVIFAFGGSALMVLATTSSSEPATRDSHWAGSPTSPSGDGNSVASWRW